MPAPLPVADALAGVHLLALDTNPVVYFVERHPAFFPVCRAVFARIDAGDVRAAVGAVTLTETLVKPIRDGDSALMVAYDGLLTNTENIDLVPITDEIARTAAYLRARHRLKTPDALQAACALGAGCDAFLTEDADLRRIEPEGIRVLLLRDLTP